MTNPAADTTVQQHDIYVMLDFPCVRDTHLKGIEALTLANLDGQAELGWIHPGRPRDKLATQPVFEKAVLNLGQDLHPATRLILADKAADPAGAPQEVPAEMPCLRLTGPGLRVLKGELAPPPGDLRGVPGYGTGKGIALPLSKSGRARIVAGGGEDAEVMPIAVEGLHLLSFRSEAGMALLHLRLAPRGPVHLAHVQEALQVVTNASRARSLGWACEAEPVGRFTIFGLLQAVLAPAGCTATPFNRLFTYTYVQLAPGAEASTLDMAAWRLSRHYTDAYLPGAEHLRGTSLSRQFGDVSHAAGLEGVATVTSPATEFVRTNFGARVETCYMPLAVMGFHEHTQLLDMGQRAALALTGEASPRLAPEGVLQALIESFLRFRLRYSLPLVSDITMHNQFYVAVRAGLEVERLTRKLAEDTADASRSLAARKAEETRREQDRKDAARRKREREAAAEHSRRERKWAPIIGFLSCQLTLLTTLALGKEVLELFHVHEKGWAVGVALIAAALSYWMTVSRHVDSHREAKHLEDEAGEDLAKELRAEGVLTTVERTALASATEAVRTAPPAERAEP